MSKYKIGDEFFDKVKVVEVDPYAIQFSHASNSPSLYVSEHYLDSLFSSEVDLENEDSDAFFDAYAQGKDEDSEDGWEIGYSEGYAAGARSVKMGYDEYYEGFDDGMNEGQKLAESKLGTMGGMVELLKKRIGGSDRLLERFLKHLDKQFDGKIGLKEE